MSEEWFEWYIDESSKTKDFTVYRDRFLCPCCFMPTLAERGWYNICPICFWEDDGQDSDDANIVRGGPNSDYSLTEARNNFEEHGTMYRVSDVVPFKSQNESKNKRIYLYNAFAKAVKSNDDADWNRALEIECKYYKDKYKSN